MSFIDQNEIYAKTDGGRLVIASYYPDAEAQGSFENQTKKFKARDKDKTRSASLKLVDGVWIVTDFGGDSKPRNCIAVVQLEESCDFKTAIQLIARNFNIVPEAQIAEALKPIITNRAQTADELDKHWYFTTKEFTAVEVQTILAPKVWEYLMRQVPKNTADPMEAVMDEVVRVFKKYNFYSLKSYRVVKEGRVTEIESTDDYPIFMFDEVDANKKSWKKIYQPKNMDAGRRFMHYGNRPADFMFGFAQAHKAYQEITRVEDDDEPIDDKEARTHKEKKDKKKPKKLKQVIMTAGGSDGLNIACIGQCFKNGTAVDQLVAQIYPVWMNSETAKLSKGQFKNLATIAEKVYNLPDIDLTGKREAHAVALEHLDIHTIFLPEELKTKRDHFRNKQCKDLRDYFRFYSVWEFFDLMKTAYPYRFWDVKPRYNKDGEFQCMIYDVNNKYLINFLYRNGFARFETESEKDLYFYIHIQNNVVRRVEPKKIRDFVNQFIESRMPEVDLMNVFLRTTQLNESSISNLPFISIDFNDFDKECQWFFFPNKSVKVTADRIEDFKPAETDKYVWEEEVIKHRFTKLDPFFSITFDEETQQHDIVIHNSDCLVMRYLINTSRIFWREELEHRLDGIPEKEQQEYATMHGFSREDHKLMDGIHRDLKAKYLEDHKFDIAGPLLTAAEQREQKQHLVNKIFSLGYMMHRHKSPSKAWVLWTMDAKISDGDESHGGTGKSLLPMLCYQYKLIKTQYIAGRDVKIVDRPHILEGITEHTDMIFIDDAHRYFRFDFFYPAITGALQVNPKNTKQYTIPFEQSPKLWFTSNFPPHKVDPSMERRIVYMLNSDYYHANSNGEYKEERTVASDFGKNLGSDFDEREWNLFLNFITQCAHFYLTTGSRKLNPPMDNVNKRNLKAGMGDAFQGWADVFFSEESEHLNKEIGDSNFVIKEVALKDFMESTKQTGWSSNKFTSAMKFWARYMGYELNPPDVKGYNKKDGRIIHKVMIKTKDGAEIATTKEMIYVRAVKKTEEDDLLPF